MTYAVSSTVNFAQGSSVMLGAVLCFAFSQSMGLPMWLAVPLASGGLCRLRQRGRGGAGRPAFRQPGLQRMADVDGGTGHRAGQPCHVHLRQGAAQPAPSPLVGEPISLAGIGLGVYALHARSFRRWGLAMAAALHGVCAARDGARRCWRWRRTGMPRGRWGTSLIRRAISASFALSTCFAGAAPAS